MARPLDRVDTKNRELEAESASQWGPTLGYLTEESEREQTEKGLIRVEERSLNEARKERRGEEG
jgi:hypothetical protein